MTDRTLVQQAALLFRLARAPVALTGAGISTPSGIPDFRSSTSGLWNDVDIEVVATIYGFRQNPAAFYGWVEPLVEIVLNARPNPAHLALAALEARGKLRGVITQNIDLLHSRAGNHIVHELHGHLREVTCIHCFKIYPAEPLIRQYLADHQLPRCPDCGAVLKPNVILFGEQLPYEPFQAAQKLVQATDLLLVVGSSLEVAPASDLPLLALRNRAHLIVVNREPTAIDHAATVVLRGDAAVILPEIVCELEQST